jgi:F-type H+-transporting ATPase subunit b
MLRAIEARQKTIADGLAAAEEGKRSLEDVVQAGRCGDQGRAQPRPGHHRAAEKRATQLVDEARNAAKEEGNREKAAAKAEIEQEVTRAREQLRERVASLAVAGAEKILRREVDAKAHGDLSNPSSASSRWRNPAP